VRLEDVTLLLASLPGVRHTTRAERSEWRYHGRLVARQLNEEQLAIRAEFRVRDALVREHPDTFSVPSRFEKHMMIVADVAKGNVAAIEDALAAAWAMQRRSD
jgi:hypothetical protein